MKIKKILYFKIKKEKNINLYKMILIDFILKKYKKIKIILEKKILIIYNFGILKDINWV